MTRKDDSAVHCCIVEDHCDILPFLRACWRKKLFTSSDLLLIHFDAHPDLAVPSTTTVQDWLNLDQLHDTLSEDECGISEFLIPLGDDRYL
jgi:hypothetical protein